MYIKKVLKLRLFIALLQILNKLSFKFYQTFERIDYDI